MFRSKSHSDVEPRPSGQSHNLPARMGRWSAAHWKTATFGWLAFVVLAFMLGGMVGVRNIETRAGPGESGRMDRILEDGFKQPATERVLIQSRSDRVGTPTFDSAIADVVARVARIADVQDVRSPLDPGNTGQISKDGRSALVELRIRGAKEDAVDKIDSVLAAVADAERAHPGFTIGEFGDASAEKGVVEAYDEDLGKAGTLSLPITLIVLVLTFGSLVAAGIPLLPFTLQIEHRVVDADGEADQEHHRRGLHRDRQEHARERDKPEGREDGSQRKEQRNAGCHQRAEREDEDDQRDRERERPRLAEVLLVRCRDAFLCACVAELADREVGMGALRLCNGGEDGIDLVDRFVLGAADLELDESRAAILRDVIRVPRRER